jgi:hypothetical protein
MLRNGRTHAEQRSTDDGDLAFQGFVTSLRDHEDLHAHGARHGGAHDHRR